MTLDDTRPPSRRPRSSRPARDRAAGRLAAVVLVAAPAVAAAAPQVPAPLAALLDCRALPDGPERRACFNATSTALSAAIADRDLVVTDRRQRAEMAKTDFGRTAAAPARRTAPAADADRPVPPARIDATIRRAARGANGRWVIVLEDGARWQQVDDRIPARDPRAGMSIAITRAALGSYLGKVDGQTALRLKRID